MCVRACQSVTRPSPFDSNELCLYLWLRQTLLIMLMLTFGASLVCDSATPTPDPAATSVPKREREREREREVRCHGKDLCCNGAPLPCCAERACVRSGSERPPVLQPRAPHRQMRSTHLGAERQQQRASVNQSVCHGGVAAGACQSRGAGIKMCDSTQTAYRCDLL